jgi:(p)ppGpp synthase/HD superfamily hydrolase
MHKLLTKAILIATDAHTGQTDKAGQPYILHPLRVMAKLDTIEEKIVGILHDVIEANTDVSLDTFREEGFPTTIIMALDCLTHRKDELYDAYIKRVLTSQVASRVKVEDLKDNMDVTRLPTYFTENDAMRTAKYKRALEIILTTWEWRLHL